MFGQLPSSNSMSPFCKEQDCVSWFYPLLLGLIPWRVGLPSGNLVGKLRFPPAISKHTKNPGDNRGKNRGGPKGRPFGVSQTQNAHSRKGSPKAPSKVLVCENQATTRRTARTLLREILPAADCEPSEDFCCHARMVLLDDSVADQ